MNNYEIRTVIKKHNLPYMGVGVSAGVRGRGRGGVVGGGESPALEVLRKVGVRLILQHQRHAHGSAHNHTQ